MNMWMEQRHGRHIYTNCRFNPIAVYLLSNTFNRSNALAFNVVITVNDLCQNKISIFVFKRL